MKPPSAQSQAFDAPCSVWLGRWIDTIPFGLPRFLPGFGLLESLLIDGRTKGALFDGLDLNGFWPGLQDPGERPQSLFLDGGLCVFSCNE